MGSGDGVGYTVNLPVPGGSGDGVYRSLVEHVACGLIREWEPELVLISAGFDAHRDDPLCNLGLSSSAFGELTRAVREIGAGPVLILEGGYDLTALFESVSEVLAALA